MIPRWTMAGILPPIRPGQPGHSIDRSPYRVSLLNIVNEFSTSAERIKILLGFLDYRSELHKLGVLTGFQWLDGSFMEDVETLEFRPPMDIDVVTYFALPFGETQVTLDAKAGNLFDNDHVKMTYHVDAYPFVLGNVVDANEVRKVSYWYSMWSHRRTGVWKGFIQIDLASMQDADARDILLQKSLGGVAP